jgi:hypothetical protein
MYGKIRNTATLLIEKNRNGSIGIVELYFKPSVSLFRDYVGLEEDGSGNENKNN